MPSLTVLAWFSPKLAYLSMIIIIGLSYTAYPRVSKILQQATSVENIAGSVILHSHDGVIKGNTMVPHL